MKYFISIMILLVATLTCQCQTNIDDYLIKDEKRPQVLLVGSFHFAYYGFDAHVTKEEDKVDIKSPKTQKEIIDLVDYIAKFKPNKIAIEGGRNSGYILRRYEAYQKDKSNLEVNEIDQIGFRLMDRFGLDTLYGVDAPGLSRMLRNGADSTTLRPILDKIFENYDFQSNDKWTQAYMNYYAKSDAMAKGKTMMENFRDMNDQKTLDRMYGAYLVGDFKNGKWEGSDALSLYWHNRNLRIMRNIQEITEGPEDRILILFGAGHMSILNHLFRCTPEYEFVSFDSLK